MECGEIFWQVGYMKDDVLLEKFVSVGTQTEFQEEMEIWHPTIILGDQELSADKEVKEYTHKETKDHVTDTMATQKPTVSREKVDQTTVQFCWELWNDGSSNV